MHERVTTRALIAYAIVGMIFIIGSASGVHAGVIKGSVHDTGGGGLQGVFVTARDTTRGIALTVVTDAEGRFEFSASAAHTLTVHQVGYVTAMKGIETGTDHRGDFTLERASDIMGALPASVLMKALPDGEEKRRLVVDCMGCHQFNQRIIFNMEGKPLDEAGWATSTEKMIGFSGPATSFPILPPDRQSKTTASWLAQQLTADRLQEHMTPPATIEGAAAKVIVTEYDVPKSEKLPIPDLPHDLMLDREGQVLITGMFTGAIYRLDPATGVFVQNEIPLGFANPRALDIDEKGNWWIVLGMPKQVARYTVKTGKWDFFDVGVYAHSVKIDADGRVWFNGHFTRDPELFGYLDATTGNTHTYEIPPGKTVNEGGSTIPYGLRVGPDGTVWGTELVGNRLVRIDPRTEQVKVYDMPSPHSGPRRLDIARDGSVWIPEFSGNKLARFDPKEETFTEYDFPTANSLPYCARIDHSRNLVWISQAGSDAIASFDMASKEFTEYRLPTRIAFIRHLDIDLDTGHVWGAYAHSPGVHPKIVRLDPGR